MTTRVRGRAVDAAGRPICGAKVHLHSRHLPVSLAAPGTEEESFLTVTDEAGKYAFSDPAVPGLAETLRSRRVLLRAVHGSRVSQQLSFGQGKWPRVAPDLVLVKGSAGSVAAQWENGTPAANMPLEIMLEARSEDGHTPTHFFKGITDQHGQLSFGPVRDHDFEVLVITLHPEAPVQMFVWEHRRLRTQQPLELTLALGRRVSGQLLTKEGQPAVGYCVAPWNAGDPRADRAVATDSDGKFTVGGVNAGGGVIAVYSQADVADLPGHALFGTPLVVLKADEDDLGPVVLPLLGTLSVRVLTADGLPVASGEASWVTAGVSHSHRLYVTDSDGVARLKRVPLGLPVDVHVSAMHPEHGQLLKVVRIPEVKEEEITVRVTGAGTVIARLHPEGAPETPLTARDVNLECDDCQVAFDQGPVSELHGWISASSCQTLIVSAAGYRDRTLEHVVIDPDGPTVLDVELAQR